MAKPQHASPLFWSTNFAFAADPIDQVAILGWDGRVAGTVLMKQHAHSLTDRRCGWAVTTCRICNNAQKYTNIIKVKMTK